MLAKLPVSARSVLVSGRHLDDATRKSIKDQIFTAVKRDFGIPAAHKLSVEIDNESSPRYLLLIRKKDSTTYELGEDGKWVGDTPATSGPTTTPTTAVPTDARWFEIDGDTIGLVVNQVVGTNEFDDGIKPADAIPAAQITADDGTAIAMINDRLHIALTEDQF